MKKILSLIIILTMCFTITAPVMAANDNNIVARSVYTIDEEIRKADIQHQIDNYVATLIALDSEKKDQYNWIYTTEYGSIKYVTRGGYPGGQPTAGVKFGQPGGSFSWTPEGGHTVDATVSFSAPFKAVTVSVDFGLAKQGGGLEYTQWVDNYTDHVKLYVDKTMEVQPFVVYRTDSYTGKKEVYTSSAVSTMYQFELSARVV